MANPLLGTWRLVRFEARGSDGKTLYPFGTKPFGRLFYDATGNMCIQVFNPDRPRFSTDDKSKGSMEEIKAAWDGFDAYVGKYQVNEKEGIVEHHLEGALFPNWIGGTQRRFFELSGDGLTISTPELAYRGEKMRMFLVWQRIT
jgi:hypothetical protein